MLSRQDGGASGQPKALTEGTILVVAVVVVVVVVVFLVVELGLTVVLVADGSERASQMPKEGWHPGPQ